MTRMNYDKEKYFFNQECATCKYCGHYPAFMTNTLYCYKLQIATHKNHVCDFYLLSRSKAKKNLKVR